MNEIQIIHDDAAEAVYCIIRNQAGQFWNTSGTPAFEAFEAANWASYAIALTAVDTTSPPATGNVALQGTFPAAIPAGFYWLGCCIRSSAAPLQTDLRAASMMVRWNGQAVTTAEAWACGALRTALAVLAGNMSFDEASGLASFLDAEDGATLRASYNVSATAVGRSQASVS